uniref:Zgc:110366 n=1 Tax=Sinocyclocheilus rhinocerous TaxID=307959 RepID=A0A673MWA6_9TELE
MVTVPSSCTALSCPTVPMSNGRNIPNLGLGAKNTEFLHVNNTSNMRLSRVFHGVRHIDTAKRYGCEEALGKAVVDSGVPREELWLTTKLWPGDYGYQSAKQACRDSCARLGVDYLGKSLNHWPDCMVPGVSSREVRAETWRALEELYDEGLCHAIGVSNFLIHHLNELKDRGGIVPHVNQVEFHPFQQPLELVEYCRKENIVFEGYCHFGQRSSPKVKNTAAARHKYASLYISFQNGVVTIPKSTKPERVHENCQVSLFLDLKDMAALSLLHDGRHVSWDPTPVE